MLLHAKRRSFGLNLRLRIRGAAAKSGCTAVGVYAVVYSKKLRLRRCGRLRVPCGGTRNPLNPGERFRAVSAPAYCQERSL